ncbi:YtxH domain-containing protein [Vibrio sp. JC009]|uniref:YtxH domain-containing protein n=1 Tax=Vibrio sp. JC009 TaxID=2912314 RepID=UPI0023AF860B|nr:YtxH domain-containing protein [Vibrio sp. JC009]WED24670.1 YtxH domain-containing protein [Vibrio sp. JC009]
MTNYNPYLNAPTQDFVNQQQELQQKATDYQSQNSNTHFIMGIAAGAAVAYLLTNKKFQKGVAATGEKAWSAVRGEVEELKERLEDTQAELEYYRNLHKGE